MRLIIILLLLTFPLYGQPFEISVRAESAVLMSAKTGKILFEKKAHSPAYPASTTKIAVALLALHKYGDRLEHLFCAEREAIASITPQAKRQSNYRSPPHWLETDGTHAGIKKGEEFKLRDLLYLMMIASANDAANVIAQSLGGTIPHFMEEVNDLLKQIGCQNTHYNNPHGLHHPQHMSTAYDLALMAKEAIQYPFFAQMVSSTRYTCPQTNLELERNVLQTNHLLRKGSFFYPKAIGIKTGFTSTAGKNLVAAAQDGDRILVAVALGYKGPKAELYQDVIKMFDTAFAEPKLRRTLLPGGEQKLSASVKGGNAVLKTKLAESLSYEFYASEETPVKVAVKWMIPPLPITKDAQVGTIQIIDSEGNLIKEAPLMALHDVHPKWTHQFGQMVLSYRMSRQVVFLGGMGVMLFIFWRLLRRKKSTRKI